MAAKDRIRIGIQLSLPFGLFRNAGIFVIYGDFNATNTKVEELKALLYGFGTPTAIEFADRLVCTKS
jgi:hypothetical protein